MISTILITNKPKPSLQNLGVDSTPHIDRLVITSDTSIGINQIKSLKAHLQTKPFKADLKTIIIADAHKLTTPAQNALLKILEEPPEYARIILITPNQTNLLPTILSRCLVISDLETPDVTPKKEFLDLYQSLPSASLAQKVSLAQTHGKTKDSAQTFVTELTQVARINLQSRPTAGTSQTLKALMTAHSDLDKNINPQLALEHLLFTGWPSPPAR